MTQRLTRFHHAAAAAALLLTLVPGGASATPPLAFELNRGQTDARVGFLARSASGTAFLTARGLTLALGSEVGGKGGAIRLTLAGAQDAVLVGEGELPGRVHQFQGRDASRWLRDIPTYAAVRAHDVLPGVDVLYHDGGGRLEYDLLVAPGVDPQSLRLRAEGAETLALAPGGELVATVGGRTIAQKAPHLFQQTAAGKRDVAGGFVLRGNEIGFEVCGYDPAQPLVIDPVVGFATYLGGSQIDIGTSIAVDAAGNVYVAGTTRSPEFPVTPGAFDTSFNAGPPYYYDDITVSKLSPDGSTMLWSTFVGGTGYDDAGGMTVDGVGNVYVAGTTYDFDFPTTANAFQPTRAQKTSAQAFLFELAAGGNALLYSTYLGGGGALNNTYAGTFGPDVAVTAPKRLGLDASGRVYMAGWTKESTFPATPDGVQTALVGTQNAFLAKLDTSASGAASLVYATFFGAGTDDASGLALDAAGRVVLVGDTSSSSFPTTPGAYDRSYNGANDVVVFKIDTSLSGPAGLVFSTFLGGSSDEFAYEVALNAAGEVFVAGTTSSTGFPTTSNAYSRSHKAGSDIFLTRLNAAGSALVYSTFFGGNGDETANGVTLDPATGYAVLTGYTRSTDLPTTSNAIQRRYNGPGMNGVIAEFNSSASGSASRVYASYLHGTSEGSLGEHATEVAIGATGSWYVTGYTSSPDFPVTPGAFQPTYGGGQRDSFVYRQNP